jgi:hypothetical protein
VLFRVFAEISSVLIDFCICFSFIYRFNCVLFFCALLLCSSSVLFFCALLLCSSSPLARK